MTDDLDPALRAALTPRRKSPREKWARSMGQYTIEHLEEAARLTATSGPLLWAAQAAREELERRHKRR